MKTIKIIAGPKMSDVTLEGGKPQRLHNEGVLTLVYIHEDPLNHMLQVFSAGGRSAKRAFWTGRFIEAGDSAGMKTEVVWEDEK